MGESWVSWFDGVYTEPAEVLTKTSLITFLGYKSKQLLST